MTTLSKLKLSFKDALSAAQADAMEKDDRVFVFGLDVPDHKRIFGSTAGLVERFGSRRCFGTPISEDAMTGVALGAAMSGLRPVHIHIRADFMLLATNQILNMVSNARYLSGGRLSAPMVIRAVIGRGWGQGAQHSKSLQSLYAHIPGLKVVMPTTPQDAYSLLRGAIEDDNPVIFLEHRWLYEAEDDVELGVVEPLGRAAVRTVGSDITFVAASWMTVEALQAARILARSGIKAEVVDVRTISPLDTETIRASVRKTGRCIVADYDWTFCGLSAEIAADLHSALFGVLRAPVERIGFAPTPCPTTRPLENAFYPSAKTLVRAAERMLGSTPSDLTGEDFYSWEKRFKGPF